MLSMREVSIYFSGSALKVQFILAQWQRLGLKKLDTIFRLEKAA